MGSDRRSLLVEFGATPCAHCSRIHPVDRVDPTTVPGAGEIVRLTYQRGRFFDDVEAGCVCVWSGHGHVAVLGDMLVLLQWLCEDIPEL